MRWKVGFTVACLIVGLSTGVRGQNLISNPAFRVDLSGWEVINPDKGSAVWATQDADGSAGSGSAFLTDTSSGSGGTLYSYLEQCVGVIGGAGYQVGSRVLIPSGQSTTGFAEIEIGWFSDLGCNTGITGNGVLTPTSSAGAWVTSSDTFTAPASARSAQIRLGVDRTESSGTLSVYFDNVFFQPSSSGGDVLYGYITVAGSVQGGFGSNFKTAVQISNPNFSAISGYFVFHPAGVPASASDPSIGWTLQPAQTASYDDIVAAMGQTGLGSMDLYVSPGAAPPVTVARVFNDAGPDGTTGFTEAVIKPSDVQGGPGIGVTGLVIGPADTANFRYNIGLRTLDHPVSVTATVKDSSGNTLTSVTHTYPANYFQQQSATDFLNGFVLGDDDSIVISFGGGKLILYGATADNTTNDGSVQFLPYIFAIA
jgi:hypothetical protein